MLLEPGQRIVDIVAPVGSLRLHARNHASTLLARRARDRTLPAIGTADVVVKRDKVVEVVVESYRPRFLKLASRAQRARPRADGNRAEAIALSRRFDRSVGT